MSNLESLERRDRRQSDRSSDPSSSRNDLPLILAEITSALGGRSAMLSLHQADGAAGQIIEMSPPIRISGLGPTVLGLAANFAPVAIDGESRWSEGILGLGSTAMLIPVQQIAGHGRLVITVFFESVTDEAMAGAERVYRERRPFATGYFHLWQTERAMRARARVAEAAFDQSDTGMLLLNRTGGIVFANLAAQKILNSGQGLRRMRGSVAASRINDSVTLQVALNHVIANVDKDMPTSSAPLVALNRDSGPPLIALLMSIPAEVFGPADAVIAMYINDPAVDIAAMLGPVCRLYRLSPVETSLVTHITHGLPLAEAAKLMNIRELTARTYMKQIFMKTDTNRQTELVVLMLSSVVRMRPAFLPNLLPLTRESAIAED